VGFSLGASSPCFSDGFTASPVGSSSPSFLGRFLGMITGTF